MFGVFCAVRISSNLCTARGDLRVGRAVTDWPTCCDVTQGPTMLHWNAMDELMFLGGRDSPTPLGNSQWYSSICCCSGVNRTGRVVGLYGG